MNGKPETATEQMEAISAKALDNYRRDIRFRALTDSAVKEAVDKHGQIDPADATEAAFSIATEAVVLALTRAFEDDAELTWTRQMLEEMKKRALEGFNLSAMRIHVQA